MLKKGARVWRENFVSTFYGINSKTLAVEGVARISNRILSKWCRDQYVTHEMPANANAKGEIERVYGLMHLVEVPAKQDSLASTIAILEALNRKAARLRKVWTADR